MDMYLDEQLEKLQTDHIDFYLLHALNKNYWNTLLENDVFDFIKSALADGRIKHIGFSFHDELPVFKKITDAYDWDFCQIQYNYMDENYQAGVEGLEYAASRGMGIIIMEPLRGGHLANRIPKEVKEIWNLSDIKRTPAQWALKFIWNNPHVTTLLSGMNDIVHIAENIETACDAYPNSFTDEELSLVGRVKETYISRTVVNCTNCKYCMPCPTGVDIPENFSMLNEASMYEDVEGYKKTYAMFMPQDKKAVNCIECGICEEKCPQNIEIRSMLKEVTKTLG